MLKDRIQEIYEFTKSESPYRKANKGWLNQDIFIDLSQSSDTLAQKSEAANVTLFWPPINSLLSNIFLILFLCSILVFTSISFAKGRFNFNLSNYSNNTATVEDENSSLSQESYIQDLNSINSKNKENLDKTDLDKPNIINSSGGNQISSDQKSIIDKIDKQEIIIKDFDKNKDIKILQNKKSKSNFI